MRITAASEPEMPLWLRILFRMIKRRSGSTPPPLRVYAWKPGILLMFLGLGRAVRSKGRLPERLKRLAMYWTARQIECAFWVDLTNRLAREAGITPEEITALTAYQESPVFTELEKDVLAYTEAMCATPVKVSDDLYRRLATQLSPTQMVELTAAIALENFSARFNRAFAIEPAD